MIIKKNMDILAGIWEKTGDQRPFTCPQCGRTLTIVQMEPIFDAENAYTPYKTVIECTACSFSLETESFTILGSVRHFSGDFIEIASWSPSGSRVISKYPHQLASDRLQELKNDGDLVEFLIVNNQAVEIIG